MFRFSMRDQRAFARLSGDFNAIHLDPVVARRVGAGEPIIHGIHLLLRALDAGPKRRLGASRWTVTARFDHPALPGESIEIAQIGPDRMVIAVDGALPLVDVTLRPEPGERTGPIGDASMGSSARFDRRKPAGVPMRSGSGSGQKRGKRRPRVWTLGDVSGAHGTVTPPVAQVVRRAFPRAAAVWGTETIAAIVALSKIVGMECPGRDSMLSAVHLDIRRHTPATSMTWRVARVDPRFRLVRLEVSSASVIGTVDAFLTPEPPPPPTMENVAAQVDPAEFAGQRALILGGSRGLGRTTALLVACGGGVPLVTFATGAAEVARLQQDAKRRGRKIEARRFDIIDDPIEKLARASASFRPTHFYYFATPRIFGRRREPFDQALFQRFAAFYVGGFARALAAVAAGAPSLSAFYPSTSSVEEPRRELTEYAAAKAAGEMLCRTLDGSTPSLRIFVSRLPRVATEQTATILRAPAADPVAVLLPIVRKMQRSPHHECPSVSDRCE